MDKSNTDNFQNEEVQNETQVDALPARNSKASNERIVARMPVDRDSLVYNMSHLKRGKAIIFNHKNFAPDLNENIREGTNIDVGNLQTCLETVLKFEVEICPDYTFERMDARLRQLQTEDHSNHDCLAVIVLSHGHANGRLACYDSYYPEEVLWEPFSADKCPALAGKPKLYFIQACRGKEVDTGTELAYHVDSSKLKEPEFYAPYVIPNKADEFIFHATAPGCYAFRDPLKGSWFIQDLVYVLTMYKETTDFLSMMTMVIQKVAVGRESNVTDPKELDKKKQVPSIRSTLQRKLYFCEPIEEKVIHKNMEPFTKERKKKKGCEIM